MAFDQKSLDNYIDVAQRIADFREQYPGGSLQPADPAHPWEQAVVTGYGKDGKAFTATMIVYTAAAYRTADDQRPGIGVAWEVFPGRTPYTLGSELMNAETSAWGRAIIAVGASDSRKGIASREEVRNRQAEREEMVCSCGHVKHRDMDCVLCGCKLRWNADGSLSRSRTSDEEKATAGVMTDADQRAHNKLEREVKGTGPQGTERLTAADPDDPWQDQPAGQAPTMIELENLPGSSDSKQRMQIALKLERAGFATQEAARAECSRITGRDIATRKDLSFTEAAAILAALDKEAASA
jgi:hypothetical protein